MSNSWSTSTSRILHALLVRQNHQYEITQGQDFATQRLHQKVGLRFLRSTPRPTGPISMGSCRFTRDLANQSSGNTRKSSSPRSHCGPRPPSLESRVKNLNRDKFNHRSGRLVGVGAYEHQPRSLCGTLRVPNHEIALRFCLLEPIARICIGQRKLAPM